MLIGSSGCGGFLRRGSNGEITIDRRALAEHLEHLDAGLESLSATRPISRTVDRYTGQCEGSEQLAVDEWLHRGDELARKALRSLFLAGAIMDVPEEARDLPEVRSRIVDMSDEMDDALLETAALLSTCPEAEKQRIRDALRHDPDLVMRVAEVVDDGGSARGLERTGRRRLREVATHVSGRLRRQSPSMLFDECVDRVERVTASLGLDENNERWLTDAAVAQMFWGESFDAEDSIESKGPEAAEEGEG